MKQLSLAFVLSLLTVTVHAQVMMYADSSRTGTPFSKDPHVICFDGRYLMYFSIPPRLDEKGAGWNIGIAESHDLVQWHKVGELTPSEEYEKKGLCAPCEKSASGIGLRPISTRPSEPIPLWRSLQRRANFDGSSRLYNNVLT